MTSEVVKTPKKPKVKAKRRTDHLKKYHFKPGNKAAVGHGRIPIPSEVKPLLSNMRTEYIRLSHFLWNSSVEEVDKWVKEKGTLNNLERYNVGRLYKILKNLDSGEFDRWMKQLGVVYPDIRMEQTVVAENANVLIAPASFEEMRIKVMQKIEQLKDCGVL